MTSLVSNIFGGGKPKNVAPVAPPAPMPDPEDEQARQQKKREAAMKAAASGIASTNLSSSDKFGG